jgi:hypothetical protein
MKGRCDHDYQEGPEEMCDDLQMQELLLRRPFADKKALIPAGIGAFF